MILTIIDSSSFTRPLARPNPRIVGNVGERHIAIFPRYFNNRPLADVVNGAWNARLRPQESGNVVAAAEGEEEVTIGSGESFFPVLPFKLPIDDEEHLPDGDYELTVTHGGLNASILVRVDQTDLHLMSAWPDRPVPVTPSTNEVVRNELVAAEAEVVRLVGVIATSQDSLKKFQDRIPKLKALLG